MTIRILKFPCLVVAGLIVAGLAMPAEAKKKKSDAETPAPAATPDATPAAAAAASPGEQLSKFLSAHLEQIVAPLGAKAFTDPQKVSELKESFADAMAVAPALKKQVYQAAIDTCTVMTQAMAEREKTMASLSASQQVAGDTSLGATRKDIHRFWTGALEEQREEQEQKNRNKQAKQQDAFLSEGQKTQWTNRAAQIRADIQRYYSRERELERQYNAVMAAAKPAAAPAAPAPAAPKPAVAPAPAPASVPTSAPVPVGN